MIQFYSQSLLEIDQFPPPKHVLGHQAGPTSTAEPSRTATTAPPTPEPGTPESAPLPIPSATKPSWWIRAADGGRREFGLITAILPSGFTHQGGASVFGDAISSAQGLVIPDGLIAGTLFAFGIWPATDQTDYQQPIEFRITLDAAQVAGIEDQLAVQMYNPGINQWVAVSAQFRPESYQMVAHTQSFTPVAKDFPSWGGRTFIGVFKRTASAETPQPTDAPAPLLGPVANRSANLRAGPGVNYPVVGGVRIGEKLAPVAKLANGSWYLLANGAWIAAFLVDNAPPLPNVESTPPPPVARAATATPSRSRTPTQTPTPIATPTPPSIHRIGLLPISNDLVADLDEGNISEFDTADMLVQTLTDKHVLLVPINGAQLAAISSPQAEFALCAQAPFSADVIEIDALPSEADICVRTKQNRLVHLRILVRGDPDTQELSLLYTIWEAVSTLPTSISIRTSAKKVHFLHEYWVPSCAARRCMSTWAPRRNTVHSM